MPKSNKPSKPGHGRIEVENCPCCGHWYGSNFPRHCQDIGSKDCSWLKCRECKAVVTWHGDKHFKDGESVANHKCSKDQKAIGS